MSLALLLAATAATAAGAAALHAARGLRREVAALRAELAASAAAGTGATVPAPRTPPADEIRAAVADALAEERERELAEARAFWAAQEARDAADAPSLLPGLSGFGEDSPLYIPRQADFAGIEPLLDLDAFEEQLDLEPAEEGQEETESPELAAARRRHPSHPDARPRVSVADHEGTVTRLEELAAAATPLSDVRPGPLGTLDVYVFADGTTICMTPGQRETAERLADALRDGKTPVLLGGSGVSGAYALTFAYGEESVYILADRVIASL